MANQTEPEIPSLMLGTLEEMKSEMKKLRADLNRLEGSILRERTTAVEEALTRNRLLMFANQLQDERSEDIKEMTKPECKNRSQCIEKFSLMSAENLEIIKALKPEEAIADFDSKIGNLQQTIERAKGAPCEACHLNFEKKLRREKRAFQTVVLVEKVRDDRPYGEELNIDYVVEKLLEPLANSLRLNILVSTFEGKKSFSKLTYITKTKGGHLIFHLKKLLDAGLIAQEDNKGDYIITQRGVDALKRILPF